MIAAVILILVAKGNLHRNDEARPLETTDQRIETDLVTETEGTWEIESFQKTSWNRSNVF